MAVNRNNTNLKSASTKSFRHSDETTEISLQWLSSSPSKKAKVCELVWTLEFKRKEKETNAQPEEQNSLTAQQTSRDVCQGTEIWGANLNKHKKESLFSSLSDFLNLYKRKYVKDLQKMTLVSFGELS